MNLIAEGPGDVQISWSSSNNDVIDASTGLVTRPAFSEDDATVILTATIRKGAEHMKKQFNITVLKNSPVEHPFLLVRSSEFEALRQPVLLHGRKLWRMRWKGQTEVLISTV